jgi:hypothetical protein
MPTPTREDQIAEGQNRELVTKQAKSAPPTQYERDAAMDVVDDTARGDLPAPREQQHPADNGDDRQPPLQTPRVDNKRDAIVARFREGRTEDDADRDEISDFARSGLPQDFQHPVPDIAPQDAPLAAEADAQPQVPAQEAEPVPAPKVRLKVRGQDIDITQEELIAAAQKGLAGDDYLREARTKLDEVDSLLRDTRNRATHPAQHGTHPAVHDGVQNGEPQPAPQVDPQQPEDDPLQKAIEAIQYGDPADARQLLGDTIQQAAASAAQSTLQAERAKDEVARSRKVLQEFATQHPELAQDPRARAAMEATVYELQIEDLKQLGIDPAKLPTRTGLVTPSDIAQAHLWYRTQGYRVRSPADLLEKAHKDFQEWRGGAKPNIGEDPPAVDPHTQPLPPRVEVRVDREQRRQAIPAQPSRSAAPPRQGNVPPAAQTRDRSTIVSDMRAKRGLPRGQIAS